jgi:hypothetical protein
MGFVSSCACLVCRLVFLALCFFVCMQVTLSSNVVIMAGWCHDVLPAVLCVWVVRALTPLALSNASDM